MSPFRYSAVLVNEWVRAPKMAEAPLEWAHEGTRGRAARQTLALATGGVPALIEWMLKAKLLDDPFTYSASLLVDHTRVRGVDYHEVARARFYRQVVPKGWHQDIYDPIRVEQRRAALTHFSPISDLQDFTRKVAILWNIQLSELPSLFDDRPDVHG